MYNMFDLRLRSAKYDAACLHVLQASAGSTDIRHTGTMAQTRLLDQRDWLWIQAGLIRHDATATAALPPQLQVRWTVPSAGLQALPMCEGSYCATEEMQRRSISSVTCRALWGHGGSAGGHSTEAADLVVAAPQTQQQAYAVVDPAPPQRAYNVRGAPQATFLGAGWAALLLVRHLIPPPCWLACAMLSNTQPAVFIT